MHVIAPFSSAATPCLRRSGHSACKPVPVGLPRTHLRAQATARCTQHAAPSAAAPDAPGAAAATGLGAVDRRTLLLGLLAAGQLLPAWQLPALADTPEITTVFVAGSTGNTGRRVVQQLRAAGYKVRAGVRDVRKAQSLGFAFDAGISIVEADVTKDLKSLEAAIGDAQAVICATGFSGVNPLKVASVDEKGTINLVNAAKARGVSTFVLLSSLLTNAAAVGQKDNPNYKILNLLGGVLDHKLAAERYLRASGLRYTIVRPGGLRSEPASEVGQLIVSKEDSLFGLDSDPGRAISRDTVAEVLVAALQQPAAANMVLEIVSSPSAPQLPKEKWFNV
uniref:NAD(P)-binding domain-containing protein n=1 Tax=Tetradesmus obliquus TaxID=3088 RepID=A0A383WCG6_TETOB|eukprot:jgi/Sobl393_1/5775/SZX75318.1